MRKRPVLGILLLMSLAAGRAAAAEVPVLLADVNQETETPFRSTAEPRDFFRVGDRLLFSTRGGYEDEGILWSTDGTAEGTQMISSALCPVFCHGIRLLTVWHGLGILVTASGESDSYASVYRLWRTDGTKAGTFPLPVFSPQEVVYSPESAVFYFSGSRRGSDNPVLWRSDGTRAGTSVFQDARGATFHGPHSFTFWRGRLHFVASDSEDGGNIGIWSTDGTPEGTAFVTTVGEGADPLSRLQATSSRLFFGSGTSAEDLWVTDGTPEGTRRLVDLNRSRCFTQTDTCEPPEMVWTFILGEKLYFITNRKDHGTEIWSSDGTESGTRPLIELAAGSSIVEPVRLDGRWLFPFSAAPNQPATLWTADDDFTRLEPLSGCPGGVCPQAGAFLHLTDSGAWLFAGSDAAHGKEVWITDGTAAGTRLLADICPGPCDGYRRRYSSSAVFDSAAGKTYFAAFSNPGTDSSVLDELWVTDGTPAGTHRVTGHVAELGLLGDLAVFGTGGLRSTIWSTDGTAAGTRRVTDLRMIAPGSDPSIHPLRKGVVFLAREGDRQALWKSDGRPEGTSRFFEFPSDRNVYDDPWIRVGGLYFFQAESTDEDPRRIELWRTDGTAQGTGRVAIFPRHTWIDLPVAWNGKLLFETEGATGCSFWSSDGTAPGTREILPPQPGVRCPTAVLALGSRFVFVARVQGPDGLVPQIFVSDGTPQGTRQISQIRTYREAFEFDEPVAVGGVAFFRIVTAESGYYDEDVEIWRTDGTPEGTYRASKLSGPADLYGFRGSLYLRASLATDYGFFRLPVHGGNGGNGGTPVLLARTPFFYDDAPSADFTPLGNRLLFVAQDDARGTELWVTDGTPAGTRLLRDIQPGPKSSRPSGLVQAGDRIFFTAQDGEHGRELWASDGTPEGTRLVWDLNPGGFSSFESAPYYLSTPLIVAGGHLFFSADDGETGVEPWSLLVPSNGGQ